MNTPDRPAILYWARGNRWHAIVQRGKISLYTLCGVEIGEYSPRKPHPPHWDVCTWCEKLSMDRRPVS